MFDDMLKAIRFWVRKTKTEIEDDLKDNLAELVRELDIDTMLRGDGDGSDVTTILTQYTGSYSSYQRELVNGGKLKDNLGRLNFFLGKLHKIAFTGNIRDLDKYEQGVTVLSEFKLDWDEASAASYFEYMEGGISSERSDGSNSYPFECLLIIGTGGAYTASSGLYGATDFARAYIVTDKYAAQDILGSKDPVIGRSFMLLQIGSLGSTARYTLTAVNGTSTASPCCLRVGCAKASWINVAAWRIKYSLQ